MYSFPKRNRRRKGKKGSNSGMALAGSGRGGSNGQMRVSQTSLGTVIRSMPLFGERTRRNIQYYFPFNALVTGTATANSYVFAANGAYDCDISGSGGQPMGFDQMMIFFNHYTVLRCRITVTAWNTSTTLIPFIGIMISGSSSVTSGYEMAVENGNIEFVPLGYQGQAGSMAKLTREVDVAKFQGITNIMDDPNMRGDSASNPTELTYFHITTWNPASATQVTTNISALLEFDTVFHEPRKGSLSLLRSEQKQPGNDEPQIPIGKAVLRSIPARR